MALITKLNEIAQAIGRKTGEPASTYTINNMASAIDSIQTDFPVVPPSPINPDGSGVPNMIQFIDYDGTIVAQFAVEDTSKITSLPEIPTHEGLTATGWTATLDEVKEATYPMLIGALYESSANPAETILQILPYDGQVITLNLTQTTANGITIDWGDGSETETSPEDNNFTVTHTYTDASNAPFEIKLTPSEDVTLGLGHGTSPKNLFNNGTNQYHLPTVIVTGKSTIIKDYAFQYCNNLQGITISNSSPMTELPTYAFAYCYINTIVIPKTVTKITGGVKPSSQYSEMTGGAFAYCYAKNIIIPNSVTEIGMRAFWRCSVQTMIIPDSVSIIGERAFDYADISNLRLPENSALTIGANAFRACRYLEAVTVPSKAGNVGAGLFSNCESLTSMTLHSVPQYIFSPSYDNTSTSTQYTYRYPYALKSITITDEVTTIGSGAFNYCYSLESIEIPDSVTNIQDYAFQDCSSLKSISIPSSVAAIGTSAFMRCYSLKSVNLPNSITTISPNMFIQCRCLESINIPSTVTSIGAGAFANCHSLKSITIPSAVTTIGNGAFQNCYNLKTVKFENRDTIPTDFNQTSIFSSATNRGSVTTLDFTECTSVPTLNGAFLNNMPSYVKIKVPASLEADWKAASGWSTYANQIVGV